jgi:colicin import membrane protein
MEAQQSQLVDTSRLVPSTVSVRKKLEDLDGLAESIRAEGILQPLRVREADARKALERAGVKLGPPKKNQAEAKAAKAKAKSKTKPKQDWKARYEREEVERKRKDAEAKVLEGAAVEIFDAVLVHVEKKGLSQDLLQILVRLAVAEMTTSWALKAHSKERRERVVRAKAGKIVNAKELLVALVDGVAYQAFTGVGTWGKNALELAPELVSMAKAAGVDWKPIRDRHVAAAAAKTKAESEAKTKAESEAKTKAESEAAAAAPAKKGGKAARKGR